MSSKLFIPLAIVVMAAMGFVGWRQIQPPPPCALMAKQVDQQLPREVVGVEYAGNDKRSADEVAAFVRSQLTAMATRDPSTPFAPFVARVELVADGKHVELNHGCGSSSFAFVPPASEVDDWRAAKTPADRDQAKADLVGSLDRGLSTVVDNVREQVRLTGFTGVTPATFRFTPLPVLQAVSGGPGRPDRIAVLSPMASTAKDCLRFDDPSVDFVNESAAADAVDGCVGDHQLETIDAGQIVLEVSERANPDATRLARARNLAAAICQHASTHPDRCSVV